MLLDNEPVPEPYRSLSFWFCSAKKCHYLMVFGSVPWNRFQPMEATVFCAFMDRCGHVVVCIGWGACVLCFCSCLEMKYVCETSAVTTYPWECELLSLHIWSVTDTTDEWGLMADVFHNKSVKMSTHYRNHIWHVKLNQCGYVAWLCLLPFIVHTLFSLV